MPDHLDNCPATGPADQTDTDGDGVGDLCDVRTCGDGAKQSAEDCDGLASAGCPGGCDIDCTCCTAVVDPKAQVKIDNTKNAGAVNLQMSIPLTSYTGEPVSVRIADGDSQPIAAQAVGVLAPKGKSGKQWLFKVKTPGVQQVFLKDDTAKHPGRFKLTIKAKKWFIAAQANQPAASSTIFVTIGNQCLSHAWTKKKD